MTTLAERVLGELSQHRLLLKQDKTLPNVVTLITGESLANSWWSHPRGHDIFSVLSELSRHPDVLFLKLIRRKDTLVHRSLWPALLGQIASNEAVLARALSAPARTLLRRAQSAAAPISASGAALKELTTRALVFACEVHTPSGRHEMQLESWSSWQQRAGVSPLASSEEAHRLLRQACERIGASARDLPWPEGSADI